MACSSSILFVGGHDPCGGAGLQADLETAASHGCRAYSLVTCLTTQDSRNIRKIHPQKNVDFREQLDCLLADVQPDLVKIGLIGDLQLAQVIATRLEHLPLVLDPVLAAGGGTAVANESLVEFIRNELVPGCQLITPNRSEARRLTGLEDADRAARQLLSSGCRNVLLTGADESPGGTVLNRLYSEQEVTSFEHPLLPESYHGSGCTLASACACQLAIGQPLQAAVGKALDWTWQTLQNADRPGQGQFLPKRGNLPA